MSDSANSTKIGTRIVSFILGLICGFIGLVLLLAFLINPLFHPGMLGHDHKAAFWLMLIPTLIAIFFLSVAWRCLTGRYGKGGALIANPVLYVIGAGFYASAALLLYHKEIGDAVFMGALATAGIGLALRRRRLGMREADAAQQNRVDP